MWLRQAVARGSTGLKTARHRIGRDGIPRDDAVSEEEMRKRLEMLRVDHRDLDAAIDALTAAGTPDQLQISRMKKRKLKLKDPISMLEDYLIPDISA